MTVYPFQIHLGKFTIGGYGLMLVVAFLLGGWIYARELKRVGKDTGIAWDVGVAAAVGGVIGAKIYYAVLMGSWAALVSRVGLVWYGGLIGGLLTVCLLWRWKKESIATHGDLIAPALAIGYSAGRIGCFLAGDDYGTPTSLPWGVAFPEGSPPTMAAVHPTQLYEVVIAFGIFLLLWRLRRHGHRAPWLFGVFLVLMGLERFFVEIFRVKDDRFLGPFTLAQSISLAMIAIGIWVIRTRWNPDALIEPLIALRSE